MPVQMGAPMQEGWGRRYALLELDTETLTDMLEPVAQGHAILQAEPIAGGLVNTNYRITLSGWEDKLIVRLYTRDPSACRLELDIYQLAHQRCPWRTFSTPIPTARAADVPTW